MSEFNQGEQGDAYGLLWPSGFMGENSLPDYGGCESCPVVKKIKDQLDRLRAERADHQEVLESCLDSRETLGEQVVADLLEQGYVVAPALQKIKIIPEGVERDTARADMETASMLQGVPIEELFAPIDSEGITTAIDLFDEEIAALRHVLEERVATCKPGKPLQVKVPITHTLPAFKVKICAVDIDTAGPGEAVIVDLSAARE